MVCQESEYLLKKPPVMCNLSCSRVCNSHLVNNTREDSMAMFVTAGGTLSAAERKIQAKEEKEYAKAVQKCVQKEKRMRERVRSHLRSRRHNELVRILMREYDKKECLHNYLLKRGVISVPELWDIARFRSV